MFTRTESFRDFIRYYPSVSFIVFIHLLLYLFTVLPFLPNFWFIETLSGVNVYIAEGEYWRLITPMFMHSGFTHMLFNSFSLILFAPPLEKWLGSFKFFLIYLLCGFLANVGTYIFEPLSYTHVGSSGAIFGIFGFYAALIVFKKNFISVDNSKVILILLAISLVMTFLQPNINIAAHLSGLAAGFLIGSLGHFNRNALTRSASEVARWASSKRRDVSGQSPLKLLVWGAIILFALLGIFIQK